MCFAPASPAGSEAVGTIGGERSYRVVETGSSGGSRELFLRFVGPASAIPGPKRRSKTLTNPHYHLTQAPLVERKEQDGLKTRGQLKLSRTTREGQVLVIRRCRRLRRHPCALRRTERRSRRRDFFRSSEISLVCSFLLGPWWCFGPGGVFRSHGNLFRAGWYLMHIIANASLEVKHMQYDHPPEVRLRPISLGYVFGVDGSRDPHFV